LTACGLGLTVRRTTSHHERRIGRAIHDDMKLFAAVVEAGGFRRNVSACPPRPGDIGPIETTMPGPAIND